MEFYRRKDYNMYYNEENRELWKNVIQRVAEESGKNEKMIEKDIVQSLFLEKLSQTDLPFVFKGGTSLSKCYGVIDRFSEDIDISMSVKPTESQRKRSKREILCIAGEIGLTLDEQQCKVYSNHDYNEYVFLYESIFGGQVRTLVEANYYLTVYPVHKQPIHNILLDFCKDRGINLPEGLYVPEFSMAVQDIQRTFIDKVFALCDYSIQGLTERNSRHLYDLYQMMPYIQFDDEFLSLIDAVRQDRMKSKNNPSAQPEYDISAMLQEIIDTGLFKDDYNHITTPLLYQPVSYETVKDNLQDIVDSRMFDSFENEKESEPEPLLI